MNSLTVCCCFYIHFNWLCVFGADECGVMEQKDEGGQQVDSPCGVKTQPGQAGLCEWVNLCCHVHFLLHFFMHLNCFDGSFKLPPLTALLIEYLETGISLSRYVCARCCCFYTWRCFVIVDVAVLMRFSQLIKTCILSCVDLLCSKSKSLSVVTVKLPIKWKHVLSVLCHMCML